MTITFFDIVRHLLLTSIGGLFFYVCKNAGKWCHRFFDDARSYIVHTHVKDGHKDKLTHCEQDACASFQDLSQ